MNEELLGEGQGRTAEDVDAAALGASIGLGGTFIIFVIAMCCLFAGCDAEGLNRKDIPVVNEEWKRWNESWGPEADQPEPEKYRPSMTRAEWLVQRQYIKDLPPPRDVLTPEQEREFAAKLLP